MKTLRVTSPPNYILQLGLKSIMLSVENFDQLNRPILNGTWDCLLNVVYLLNLEYWKRRVRPEAKRTCSTDLTIVAFIQQLIWLLKASGACLMEWFTYCLRSALVRSLFIFT